MITTRQGEVDTANQLHEQRRVQWFHSDDDSLVLNARLTRSRERSSARRWKPHRYLWTTVPRNRCPQVPARGTRSAAAAIWRALQARDGGFCFPGCTNRRFVDGHHIRHWASGGETSLANLTHPSTPPQQSGGL